MLRDYQIESLSQIRDQFRKGNKKCLLWLATGSGKTTIFCDMVRSATQNGKKSLIVVRRRLLVENACQRLRRENISHGTLMAGHWNRNHNSPVQVASIDTLIARNQRPEADLIIIDEAHMRLVNGIKTSYLIILVLTWWRVPPPHG